MGTPLRCRMRDLWDEHAQYTRMAIIAFANGLPELEVTVQRLQHNQDALGEFFGAHLGAETGYQVATLLHEHIDGAVELLKAVKSGDEGAIAAAREKWNVNGRAIAAALASTGLWPYETLADAMQVHLDTTFAEAGAELAGNWAESIAAYDAARDHVLMMAKVFADGMNL